MGKKKGRKERKKKEHSRNPHDCAWEINVLLGHLIFFFLEEISSTYNNRILLNDIQERASICSQEVAFTYIFLHRMAFFWYWEPKILGDIPLT